MIDFDSYSWEVSEEDLTFTKKKTVEGFRSFISSFLIEWIDSLIDYEDQEEVNEIKSLSKVTIRDDEILEKKLVVLIIPKETIYDFINFLETKGINNPKIYISDMAKAKEIRSSLKIKKLLKIKKDDFIVGDIVIAKKNQKFLLTRKRRYVSILKGNRYVIRGIFDNLFEIEDGFGETFFWDKKFFKLEIN